MGALQIWGRTGEAGPGGLGPLQEPLREERVQVGVRRVPRPGRGRAAQRPQEPVPTPLQPSGDLARLGGVEPPQAPEAQEHHRCPWMRVQAPCRDRRLAEAGCGGGRARRPAEPGPGDQWKQGRTGSGRLRVLDSEQGKGLDGAAAGYGWEEGREILVLPARAAAALREDEGARAMEIWSGGGGRFGKEINWIARVSFVQLTCGPGLKYEACRDSLGARTPWARERKGCAHLRTDV